MSAAAQAFDGLLLVTFSGIGAWRVGQIVGALLWPTIERTLDRRDQRHKTHPRRKP